MLKKLRKSSGRVTLVLIGVAALGGCGGDDARRDVYATREDCLADWGTKPEECTAATEERHRALVMHRVAMHRGEEAKPAQSRRERSLDSGRRARRERIHHEVAKEARRMRRDRRRHGSLVAGNARDERRALHTLPVEFSHPLAREFRWVCRGHLPTGHTLCAEQLKKIVREKMHMRV